MFDAPHVVAPRHRRGFDGWLAERPVRFVVRRPRWDRGSITRPGKKSGRDARGPGDGCRTRLLPRSLHGRSRAGSGCSVENNLYFRARKARNFRIERYVGERLQLDRKRCAIPAGVEGELVVGQRVGSALCRIEAGKAKNRHVLQAEQFRRIEAAMSGDDPVVAVDEDRIGEAESGDAAGNLPDLFFGVGAGVARRRATAIGSIGVGFMSGSLRELRGSRRGRTFSVYKAGGGAQAQKNRRRCALRHAGSSTPALYS